MALEDPNVRHIIKDADTRLQQLFCSICKAQDAAVAEIADANVGDAAFTVSCSQREVLRFLEKRGLLTESPLDAEAALVILTAVALQQGHPDMSTRFC
jgi:hypothetical protein